MASDMQINTLGAPVKRSTNEDKTLLWAYSPYPSVSLSGRNLVWWFLDLGLIGQAC